MSEAKIFCFPKDPREAGKQYAAKRLPEITREVRKNRRRYDEGFEWALNDGMIPRTLDCDVFWKSVVESFPEYERKVPHYLTRNPMNDHDCYRWISVGMRGPRWHPIDGIDIVKVLQYADCDAKSILDITGCNQQMADEIWDSRCAVFAFDAISDEYIRQEWRTIMTLYKGRRKDVENDNESEIQEYCEFCRESNIVELAIKLEQKLIECFCREGWTIELREWAEAHAVLNLLQQ